MAGGSWDPAAWAEIEAAASSPTTTTNPTSSAAAASSYDPAAEEAKRLGSGISSDSDLQRAIAAHSGVIGQDAAEAANWNWQGNPQQDPRSTAEIQAAEQARIAAQSPVAQGATTGLGAGAQYDPWDPSQYTITEVLPYEQPNWGGYTVGDIYYENAAPEGWAPPTTTRAASPQELAMYAWGSRDPNAWNAVLAAQPRASYQLAQQLGMSPAEFAEWSGPIMQAAGGIQNPYVYDRIMLDNLAGQYGLMNDPGFQQWYNDVNAQLWNSGDQWSDAWHAQNKGASLAEVLQGIAFGVGGAISPLAWAGGVASMGAGGINPALGPIAGLAVGGLGGLSGGGGYTSGWQEIGNALGLNSGSGMLGGIGNFWNSLPSWQQDLALSAGKLGLSAASGKDIDPMQAALGLAGPALGAFDSMGSGFGGDFGSMDEFGGMGFDPRLRGADWGALAPADGFAEGGDWSSMFSPQSYINQPGFDQVTSPEGLGANFTSPVTGMLGSLPEFGAPDVPEKAAAAPTPEQAAQPRSPMLAVAQKAVGVLGNMLGDNKPEGADQAPRRREGQSEQQYQAEVGTWAASTLGLDAQAMAEAGLQPGTPEYMDFILQQADQIIADLGVDPEFLAGASVEQMQQQFRQMTGEQMSQLYRALAVRGQLDQSVTASQGVDPFTGMEEEFGGSFTGNREVAAAQRGVARRAQALGNLSGVDARDFLSGMLGNDIDLYDLQARRAERDKQAILEEEAARDREESEQRRKRQRNQQRRVNRSDLDRIFDVGY